MRCRSLSMPRRSTPQREATWIATIATPVSRTNVFEKTLTTIPAKKPARLPPESCLMISGSSQSSDWAAMRSVAGEEDRDVDKASRRVGRWRLARKRPVDRPNVMGAADRRRAPRQSAIVAILKGV